ncbi:MarR family transcriptional regulator [uncultured Aquabacterium sp.]|jgi:DNA-binding MarR family transcriptional regulator|uniref:MarR family winged helix-turn-helix transcriptional regulator n=1 Tax=uncultured Aquabacterium sp. TaxID=158753 RepID=UPI002622F3C8|nr:MarR family transcriptional regulator [uncultured Aquabacterium sp.]
MPDPQDTPPGCCPAPADFYVQDRFSRHESVGYLMRRIMQLLVTEVDHRLQDIGLTNAQWAPLFTIHKIGTTTLAELSRELQTDPGALTRTLDRLEAKGLVRRERSTSDRRVVHLALTPDGEAAMAPVPGVLCEVMNAYLAGFTHEEWQTLLEMLRRMQANAVAFRARTDVKGPGTQGG